MQEDSKLKAKRIFEQSKIAKGNKDYVQERELLEEAISLDPQNTKILNALIKNSKKFKDNDDKRRIWLERLFELRPDGRILFELLQMARSKHNVEWERELLHKKQELEPGNKKAKKRLIIIGEGEEKKQADVLDVDFSKVKIARDVIYSEGIIQEKQGEIEKILENQSIEVKLAVLAELYASNGFGETAQKLIKRYKKELEKVPENNLKLKIANKVFELVANKKTKVFNWNAFWMSMRELVKKKENLAVGDGPSQNSKAGFEDR